MELRANTDLEEAIGRLCAWCVELNVPDSGQETKPPLGFYFCLQSKFPPRITILQQNISQVHAVAQSPDNRGKFLY